MNRIAVAATFSGSTPVSSIPGRLRACLAPALVWASRWPCACALTTSLAAPGAWAAGFDRINTTVTDVNAILVTISVAVVTIAIIWAGFKMIFQGARLADVANVLIGGTLVGGAASFAAFIAG
jgi:type IV secretion system protein VirB2